MSIGSTALRFSAETPSAYSPPPHASGTVAPPCSAGRNHSRRRRLSPHQRLVPGEVGERGRQPALDLGLPDMSGIRVQEEMRRRYADPAPVLIYTARDLPPRVESKP